MWTVKKKKSIKRLKLKSLTIGFDDCDLKYYEHNILRMYWGILSDLAQTYSKFGLKGWIGYILVHPVWKGCYKQNLGSSFPNRLFCYEFSLFSGIRPTTSTQSLLLPLPKYLIKTNFLFEWKSAPASLAFPVMSSSPFLTKFVKLQSEISKNHMMLITVFMWQFV